MYYEGLNRPEIGAYDGYFLQGNLALLRYQLAGYAWAKPLLENPLFLADFNQQLYSRILTDPSTRYSESALLNIGAGIAPSVEGKSYAVWYVQQHILNLNPPAGYFLFHRGSGENCTVDYFSRDTFGQETLQTDATVQWTFYDDGGRGLNNGSSSTAPRGWFGISSELPSGYSGRIKLVTSTLSPNGTVSHTSFWFASDASGARGVFGVIVGADVGSVTVTPLDSPLASTTVNVINGGFSAPSLTTVRGRFRAVFTRQAESTRSRIFTKDASDYFLVIEYKPILGDLNDDGVVDIEDYGAFRVTLGKREGDVGYNANADYDGDKRITYADYRFWYNYYKSWQLQNQ